MEGLAFSNLETPEFTHMLDDEFGTPIGAHSIDRFVSLDNLSRQESQDDFLLASDDELDMSLDDMLDEVRSALATATLLPNQPCLTARMTSFCVCVRAARCRSEKGYGRSST